MKLSVRNLPPYVGEGAHVAALQADSEFGLSMHLCALAHNLSLTFINMTIHLYQTHQNDGCQVINILFNEEVSSKKLGKFTGPWKVE